MSAVLLAKSPERGGLTLAEHTEHVLACAVRFADAWGFDRRRASGGAILHDLGKGHPATQAMLLESTKLRDPNAYRALLSGAPWRTAVDREMRRRIDPTARPHRHELSSLAFLPLFPEADWPDLIEMVAAHHKSVLADASGRGFLDLAAPEGLPDVEPVRDRHLEGWEAWAPAAIEVAAAFGVEPREITRKEAEWAFEQAFATVRRLPRRWSPWRGLLMAADHFASAYLFNASEQAERLFSDAHVRDVYGPAGPFPPSEAYPLSLRNDAANDLRPHTLVVAPTGAGKTNFLLRRCTARVFYTLPFQASINAMAARMGRDLPDGADVRRLHAASDVGRPDDVDGREEDVRLQRLPGASVKVLTPHQLASVVFGTAGYEAVALDLRGQDVILDEVHTYGPLALSMVERLIRVVASLGCRVHVGTATIPKALRDLVVAALGGETAVCEVRLTEPELDRYDRHTVVKVPTEEDARNLIAEALEAGQRVLVVSNRVARAQERFEWTGEACPGVPRLLIHSRFRRGDRAALEEEVKRMADGPGPCLVSATQVVEVSLDVSFDLLVTDAAPLDAMIQRFGRVNRHARGGRLLKPVVIVAPPDTKRDALPYDLDTVRRSFDALPIGPLRERSLQCLIDAVYPTVEKYPIDLHLSHDEDLTERMSALQHRPRSVIVEALQIESRTAVRASDRHAYERGTAAERSALEIPAPEMLGRLGHQNGWPTVERGAWPVVVPDDQYDAVLGLLPLRKVEPADPTESFNARAF